MESGKRTKSEFLNSENSVFISPFYKESNL